ncbi:putative hemolysin [Paenibacillus aceris]|uniref:Hemolysin n=1 Tax=Paenibacillus aceris TaxID=869555 RepID=A0ABS4I0N7_9BACL|nr:putative hemolysin [Paenibacillus aceris]
MLYLIVLIPVLLLMLFGVFILTRKVRDKVETSKVINMSLYQSKKASKAPTANKKACSFCRKKEKKLAFYSDEQGRVVGVCSVCRPQAERRALMRL